MSRSSCCLLTSVTPSCNSRSRSHARDASLYSVHIHYSALQNVILLVSYVYTIPHNDCAFECAHQSVHNNTHDIVVFDKLLQRYILFSYTTCTRDVLEGSEVSSSVFALPFLGQRWFLLDSLLAPPPTSTTAPRSSRGGGGRGRRGQLVVVLAHRGAL